MSSYANTTAETGYRSAPAGGMLNPGSSFHVETGPGTRGTKSATAQTSRTAQNGLKLALATVFLAGWLILSYNFDPTLLWKVIPAVLILGCVLFMKSLHS